jgi:hypothetical protein
MLIRSHNNVALLKDWGRDIKVYFQFVGISKFKSSMLQQEQVKVRLIKMLMEWINIAFSFDFQPDPKVKKLCE